ncbi:AsmA family protein [Kiritimatiella glycovorans]|uniref:Uncharacterized protein n=1 Tax=Kiritimatiella glycovorans TaxID=1307763 RepID=A0A0G3EMS9_9BACT|nr:AsmA family protein [Kiritimatiella glycovorans]AKJ65414.1 putative protein involved in outer membrane biogenesis [Kiritimatiella glycovorans]
MKMFLRLIGIFALVLIVLMAAAVLFLKYGLTGTVRDRVLPEVQRKTQAELSLEHAAVAPLAGRITLEEVAVRNPPAFVGGDLLTVEHAEAAVELFSFLGDDTRRIHRVVLTDLQLNLVRDREGRLNAVEFIRDLQQATAAGKPDTPAPEEEGEDGKSVGAASPPLALGTLEADGAVTLEDRAGTNLPPLAFDYRIRGRNLSTRPAKETPPGEIYLMGDLRVGDKVSEVNVNATVEPLVDPAAPTFSLEGRIADLSPQLIDRWLPRAGLSTAPFTVTMKVAAQEGEFEPGSTLGLELADVSFSGKLTGGTPLHLSKVRLDLPVRGSVRKPVVDWKSSVQRLVRNNLRQITTDTARSILGDRMGDAKDLADRSGRGVLEGILGLALGTNRTVETGQQTNAAPSAGGESEARTNTSPDQAASDGSGTPATAEAPAGEGREAEPEPETVEEQLLRTVQKTAQATNREEAVRQGVRDSLQFLLRKAADDRRERESGTRTNRTDGEGGG